MVYYFPIVPDTAVINFSISGPVTGSDVHFGSSYLVDDISFEGTSDVPTRAGMPPSTFALEQNYPNPFNPATCIGYQIADSRMVRPAVYDVIGREVAMLVSEKKPAGVYWASFNASGSGSGIYFYRLTAGDRTETRKMTLLK